jgi:hypothetical protein
MASFLKKSLNNDSAAVRFDVKDVSYFADASFYECEFTVSMISKKLDTTGIMRARVSKDFSTVTRKW